MLLLRTSVENLPGYEDITRQFTLCTFNLRDQPTKRERERERQREREREREREERERVLKNNKLWRTCAYICLLYIQDRNQDMLMQLKTSLFICSVNRGFPIF